MTNDNTDTNSDGMLNRLIRASRNKRTEEYIRPDDEAVIRYVSGTATDSQRDAIQSAMAESAQFRAEMVALITEVDSQSYDTENISSQDDKDVPSLKDFMSSRAGESDDQVSTIYKQWWKVTRVLVPLAAVAAIAIIAIQSDFFKQQQVQQWKAEVVQVEASSLIKMQVRGSDAKVADSVYATAQDAAIAAFREMIISEEFELKPNKDYVQLTAAEPLRTYHLTIVDNDYTLLFEEFLSITFQHGAPPENVQLWMLSMPGRTLRHIDVLGGDDIKVTVPEKTIEWGCAVLIYGSEGNFRFGPGFLVNYQ